MKTKIILLAAVVAFSLNLDLSAKERSERRPPDSAERPIDLVICLDASNSMDGLIGAAKQKLWDIVNELGKARPKPHLRVGLYSYGTPSYGAETGFVRKEIDLTDDLDSVYAKLTALVTHGGDEYVARVVRLSANEQSWSPDRDALKIIVVAGNEPYMAKKRDDVQKEINDMSVQRKKYIDAEIKKSGKSTDKAFDAAMLKAIREQAFRRNFKFDENPK